MKRNLIWPIVCISIMLNGCGPGPLTAEVLDPDRGGLPGATLGPTVSSSSATPTFDVEAATLKALVTTAIPLTPEIIDVTPPPTAVPPSDPASMALIEKAKADLAQRLSLDSSSIALIEFRSVVWPDGSLGCPEPGMAYIQVLIEGYFIQLGVGERVFHYHGAQNGEPFLCESSEEFVPPPGYPDS